MRIEIKGQPTRKLGKVRQLREISSSQGSLVLAMDRYNYRAEGALSIESPENIVGNRSVLKKKKLRIPLWPSEN